MLNENDVREQLSNSKDFFGDYITNEIGNRDSFVGSSYYNATKNSRNYKDVLTTIQGKSKLYNVFFNY